MSLPTVIMLLIILQIPVWAGSVIIEEDLFLPTEIIQKAYDFLNTPYLYGGAERTGPEWTVRAPLMWGFTSEVGASFMPLRKEERPG